MTRSLLVLLLALLGLSACNPMLYQASAPPPARAARLDPVTNFWGITKRYRLEVSTGIAVALRCEDGGPCEHMKVVSDDPAIAEVRLASLSQLESSPYPGNNYMQQPLAALVVVGKAPGKTKLHVTTKGGGSRDVTITVIPAPSAGNPVTAAK